MQPPQRMPAPELPPAFGGPVGVAPGPPMAGPPAQLPFLPGPPVGGPPPGAGLPPGVGLPGPDPRMAGPALPQNIDWTALIPLLMQLRGGGGPMVP